MTTPGNSATATTGGWRDRLRRALNRLQQWVQPLVRFWHGVLEWLTLLLLIRFSLILGIVCALVLFLNDQSQDILHALGEDPFSLAFLSLPIAALFCAWIAWYTARLMYYFHFGTWSASAAGRFPRTKEYLPRLLGASCLGLTGLATLTAAIDLRGSSGGLALYVLTAVLLLLTAGFVLWAWDWDRRFGAITPGKLARLSELPREALSVPAVALLGLLLIWLFGAERTGLAQELGTVTIVYLAAAALIASGSIVVWLGTWLRLPLVELLVVLAVIFSTFVENHLIRIEPGQASYDNPLDRDGAELRVAQARHYGKPPAAFADAPDLKRYLTQWLHARAADGDGPIPAIVVAAEGGGLRAAYWTGLVLAHLQDEVPEFARHVVAISGVSGGSLGAATFAALLADGEGQGECAGANLVERADAILGRDFLAPTVASFLFGDLPQRFVPASIWNDRGVTLEKAWEAAWRACQGSDRFAAPFVDLWDKERRFEVPLLFLNSTLVETGQRVIATPLPFDVDHARLERRCGDQFDRAFNSAWPAACLLGYRLPLSTAVHDSARFTYISPAGTIPRYPGDDHRPKLHLVDGGYFENSGAVTAYEILRQLEAAADAYRGAAIQLLPIVVQISNDPLGTDPEELRQEIEATEFWFLTQLRAPLKALLNVRPARGYQARESLRSWVLRETSPEDGLPAGADPASIAPAAGASGRERATIRSPGVHLHFRLCKEKVHLPLGWALSDSAQEEMRRQLGLHQGSGEASGVVRVHQENIDVVLRALRHRVDNTAPPRAAELDPWSCPG